MSYFIFLSIAFLLCNYSLPRVAAQSRRGIPGTTQTLSGYDTELGKDPVCWTSFPAAANEAEAYPLPNPLVANFSVAGNITLQKECPMGNLIDGFAPVNREQISTQTAFQRSRLRTGIWHTYNIRATFNLTSLGYTHFVSDMGPTVAFQIVLCINGISGFCSPFIHEEANDRIIRETGEAPNVLTGNRHGETHVHSPKVFRNLTFEEGPIYEIDVDVPVLVNDEADVYAIAAVQFFVGDTPDRTSKRYDMANALVEGQRLIVYQEPAKILDVTPSVLAFCHVLRGMAAIVIAFLLGQTIYHRKHRVLELSQQPFLVVFLAAALVATIGSFLIQPKNDFYCRWSSPVVLSSLQLVIAVIAGRLWRINSVISPLLAQTLRKKESSWNRLMRRLRRGKEDKGSHSSIPLRREVQPWHLTVLICFLTLPQVMIQLATAIWQPQHMEIEFNDDESIGRTVCTNDTKDSHNLVYYGFAVFVFSILLLIGIAQTTRHLPSLFNETEVIFDTAVSSLVLLILGVAVVVITDDPTTSPGITYLAWSIQVLCITVNTSCRIMLPKLKMVWRGETVLVSKLVAEHSKKAREDDNLYLAKRSSNSGTHGSVNVSGLRSSDMNGRSGSYRQRRQVKESDSQDLVLELENFERATSHSEGTFTEQITELISDAEPTTTDIEEVPSSQSAEAAVTGGDPVVPSGGASTGIAPKKSFSSRSLNNRRVGFKEGAATGMRASEGGLGRKAKSERLPRSTSEDLLIHHDQAPPKRLLVKMYDLQARLADVNQRILSGMAVPEEEWETLRRLTTRMGDTFKHISFAWKTNEMSTWSLENEEKNGDAQSDDGPAEEAENNDSLPPEDFPDEANSQSTSGVLPDEEQGTSNKNHHHFL